MRDLSWIENIVKEMLEDGRRYIVAGEVFLLPEVQKRQLTKWELSRLLARYNIYTMEKRVSGRKVVHYVLPEESQYSVVIE
jgi:hypothetical protein